MVPHKRTDAGDRSPPRTEWVVGGLWGGRTRDDPRRRKRDRLRWVGVQVLGEGLRWSRSGDPLLQGAMPGPGPRGSPDPGRQHGPWVGRPGRGGVSSSSRMQMRWAAQLKCGQGGPSALGPAGPPLGETTFYLHCDR